ncbi:hypothetical protein F511_22898 [Dorcoceras hygrometricum]|uniref:Uncharacterized protein n=1 Tax=Dorcoceras hygrometricum TaxID=472368 RepID=A0A2Z7BSQ5_9LAMI|nr:hypothetical protein F511_22898 [Dorcoceras hygrometricum]
MVNTEDNHRIPHTTLNPSVRTAANSRQSSAAVPPNPLAKVLRKLRRVQKLCYQISHRNPASSCAKFSRIRTPIPDFVLPVFSPAEFKRLVYLIQTPLALIFAFVIWVYEIFRLSGLLCVTNGLDPEFKRLVYLIQTPLALIFAFVIWVYEIFRLSGLLCVTNGLDPLEEQNLGTDQ